MDSTSQKLMDQLTQRNNAQRDADARVAQTHAEGMAAIEKAITERSRELVEANHGMTVHTARAIATREIQAARAAEAEARDRARVDEQIKSIAERDREATSADSLRERLRKLASTPADFDQRVAEEKQRQRIEREAAADND